MKVTLKLLAFFLLVFAGFFGLTYQVCARSGLLKTTAILSADSEVKPDASVRVQFSNPVISSTFEGDIDIQPAIDFKMQWNDKNTELTFTPQEYWKPGTRYEITISGGKNIFFFPLEQSVFFNVTDYPHVKAFYPENEANDTLITMENPISAMFEGPVDDFSFKFVLNPFDDLEYQVSEDKTKISLLPKKGLQEGKRYSVSIMTKYKQEDEGMYRQIYAASFDTPSPKPTGAPTKFADRLAQALKETKPQATSGKFIDINLKQQVMVIFENGTALDAYMVSSGKKGMETPVGEYAIRNKSPKPWSKEYSLFMPNWMALVPDGKFGIHELPEWPGGYKEGANHLGTPVSHGCVRLGVGPAKRVYDWAEVGTPVSVHY